MEVPSSEMTLACVRLTYYPARRGGGAFLFKPPHMVNLLFFVACIELVCLVGLRRLFSAQGHCVNYSPIAVTEYPTEAT